MSKRIIGMAYLSRPVGSTEPYRYRPPIERELRRIVQEVTFTGVHIGNRHPRTYITAESKDVLVKGVTMDALKDMLR